MIILCMRYLGSLEYYFFTFMRDIQLKNYYVKLSQTPPIPGIRSVFKKLHNI